MDKTHNISLGGFSFTIENDAYQKLSTYLMKVRQFLGDSSDTNEIIFDVEQRMAELLKAHTQTVEVVTQEDVDYLIEVLGKPEQYVDESQEAITEEKRTKFSFKGRKLYRDMDDKKIGGVLSGISYYFQIDVSLLRIIFLLLFLTNSFAFFFSTSFWLLLYIIFWVVVPPANTTAEKLEMKGVAVNLDTLSSFKENTHSQRKEWYRSVTDWKLGGVLGGFAQCYSLNSTWLRIGYVIFSLLFFFTRNVGMLFPVILYLILWVLLKKEGKEDEKNRNAVKESSDKISKEPHNSSFFWSFFRIFFKAIGYFIATIIFIVLFSVFLSLLLSLLGVGFAGGITSVLLTDYAPFILSEWQKVLFYIILAIAFVLLFSILVLFCFKIFSSSHYKTPKAWFLANILLFVFSLLGGLTLAASVCKNFVAENRAEEKIPINVSSDTLFIQEKHIAPWQYSILLDSKGDGKSGKVHFLKLASTQEKTPFLLVETYSKGRNIDDALENAQKINFPLEIKDNNIQIPNGFLLKKGNPFRFQEVYIKLFVPSGKVINFSSFPTMKRESMLPQGTFQVINDSIIKK